MRKLILPVILGLLAAGIYAFTKYGYLVTSYRNLPPQDSITETAPLDISTPDTTDRELSYLKVPEGFAVTYFAKEVPGARSLTAGGTGVVYVGSRPQKAVYALEDSDRDGRAETRYTVASGLNHPNGVAYHNGDLYVAEIGRILVFRGIDTSYRNNPAYDVIYDRLPKDTHHGWRYIRIGPDSKLYIGIGAPCNVCSVEDPFAAIARLNLDGTGFEVVQRGIRNTVGFDWNPSDGSLWFTDNGRDQMGDDTPPDELNRSTGTPGYFGFPFCHGNGITDPQFNKGENCAIHTSPKAVLGPHVAALGFRFYRGSQFPDEYKSKVIIAEHGSWNRSVPIGYRLMTVDIQGEKAENYKEFVTGWLEGEEAKGRPVDVLELKDGSILVSDDLQGAVYRITYAR